MVIFATNLNCNYHNSSQLFGRSVVTCKTLNDGSVNVYHRLFGRGVGGLMKLTIINTATSCHGLDRTEISLVTNLTSKQLHYGLQYVNYRHISDNEHVSKLTL